VLLFTSWKLTLFLVGIVVLVVIPLIAFGRWIRTLSRKSQDRIDDTSAHASEILNAVQTVQAFTHEALERAQFGRAVEKSFDVAILRTRARAVMAGVGTFPRLPSHLLGPWGWRGDVVPLESTSW